MQAVCQFAYHVYFVMVLLWGESVFMGKTVDAASRFIVN